MGIKTVTYWETLIRLARAAAQEPDNEEAQRKHEEYRQLVLESDECILPVTRDFL